MSEYAVRVNPGEMHFSATHFITFNGTCENLHGHHFHVKLEARGENTGDAFVKWGIHLRTFDGAR